MSSGKTLEQRIIEKIRLGEPKEKILDELSKSHFAEELGTSAIRRDVAEIVDTYPDYGLIQNIMKGKIIQEINGRDMFVINPKTRTIQEITNERLLALFDKKVDLMRKKYTCNFIYNPQKMSQLELSPKNIWMFNKYIPPFWQEDFFYDGIKIPKVSELPSLYEKYFLHLVANDLRSFEYILDWIAFGLQDRNFCILTTIGMSGAGKGKLGEILELLFGPPNFAKTGNNLLTKDFNAQAANKRLVYINEASVKDQSQEERVKALVDFSIEIEKKGKDAYQSINHANFYFSSNFLDAIRIPEKDRRFSIVNLTDKQLEDVMTGDEIDALKDLKNIEQLAQYLFHRPVLKKNMIKPFKSERTEEVREAGLNAWQEWFLEDYCIENAGKIIPLTKVSEDIQTALDTRFRPSKAALRTLQNIYPNKFKLSKPRQDNGKQPLVVEFPPLENKISIQTTTEVLSKSSH